MARDLSAFKKTMVEETPEVKPAKTFKSLEDATNDVLGIGDLTYIHNDIQEIAVDMLDPYQDEDGKLQPFKMYTPEQMESLTESISLVGLHTPIIAKPVDNNRYMIIAGHNRVEACRVLGLSTIKTIVKDIDQKTARYIMLSTNLEQRDELLPSELARSIGEYMEITKELSSGKTNISAVVANKFNFQKRQIFKYNKLNKLTDEFLQMVDDKILTLAEGEKLANADKQQQEVIYKFIVDNKIEDKNINLANISQILESDLADESLKQIFSIGGKPQSDKPKKIKVYGKKTLSVIEDKFADKAYNDDEIADILNEALEAYFKNQ